MSASPLTIRPGMQHSDETPSSAVIMTPSSPDTNDVDTIQRDQDLDAAWHFKRTASGTSAVDRSELSLSPEVDTAQDEQKESHLNAQMEQDVHFFSAGAMSASPGHRDARSQSRAAAVAAAAAAVSSSSSPSRVRVPTVHHQAAAARMYRHQRNLSDTSLDSSHGAFIDHRHQIGSAASPFGLARPTIRLPQSRKSALREEVEGPRTRRRTATDASVDGIDGNSPPLPAAVFTTNPEDEAAVDSLTMSASATTARPMISHESTDPRAASTDCQDFDDMYDHRPRRDSSVPLPNCIGLPHLNRQTSTSSRASRRSNHGRRTSDAHSLMTSCRRPSQAEQDVCFPMLTEQPTHMLVDPRSGLQITPNVARGIPGVLPNFPHPFDFNSLEEFADKERDTWDAESQNSRQAGPVDITVASPLIDVDASRRCILGPGSPRLMQDLADNGLEKKGRLGMLKQRRLSESIGPVSGRQRKLAVMEGGSGSGGPGETVGARPELSKLTTVPGASGVDSKTPLLGMQHRGYSTASGAGGRRPNEVQVDRPYRFSFYSNALPATIHARSLAEIPADGQSFEDLFAGRLPADDCDISVAGTEPAPGMPNSGANTGGTGTPNLKANDTSGYALKSSAHSSLVSAGILQAQAISTLSAQNPLRLSEGMSKKEKQNHSMRTDQDTEANTWWLDVLCPTDKEMKVLSKVFGIHPLTTEDIQMEETREKIELFRNYYLVCFRSFDQDPYSSTYLEPLNMYIIVFREGTLSFHFRGTPHPQNVRRRIKQLKDYINVTADWISYALIDDITDAFGPLIQSIEYEVDNIDELVLILKDAEQSDMLRRIGSCRKKVMGLLRLMGSKADVVKGLAKRCNENWSVAPKSDIGLYLSDIQDHLVTMTQNLNHYEKILSRSHSNYLAQISIEMTDANNQINDVLSKLTALGSILVPMNLVTGLWGMNVHVPGQDIESGYTWFISIVCGLVAFGVLGAWLTLRYFKFSYKK